MREIAIKGNFTPGWVAGEQLWKDYEAKHKKVAKKAAAVSLTPTLQAEIGVADERLEELRRQELAGLEAE